MFDWLLGHRRESGLLSSGGRAGPDGPADQEGGRDPGGVPGAADIRPDNLTVGERVRIRLPDWCAARRFERRWSDQAGEGGQRTVLGHYREEEGRTGLLVAILSSPGWLEHPYAVRLDAPVRPDGGPAVYTVLHYGPGELEPAEEP